MQHPINSLDDLAAVPAAQREACQIQFVRFQQLKKAIEGLADTEFGDMFHGAVRADLAGMAEGFIWDDEKAAAV